MSRHYSMSRGSYYQDKALSSVIDKTVATLVPIAQQCWQRNQTSVTRCSLKWARWNVESLERTITRLTQEIEATRLELRDKQDALRVLEAESETL